THAVQKLTRDGLVVTRQDNPWGPGDGRAVMRTRQVDVADHHVVREVRHPSGLTGRDEGHQRELRVVVALGEVPVCCLDWLATAPPAGAVKPRPTERNRIFDLENDHELSFEDKHPGIELR